MKHPNAERDDLPQGITREVLERDGLRAALAARHPEVEMVSDAHMRRSIADMLAARPTEAATSDAGVWLFGYGSLLWNPCVPVAAWRDARLYGFHRDFRIQLCHGRGSPEAPGLMLGLVPGGACRGMAMKLAPHCLEHELLMVWRREMLTGVYVPRWVTLRAGGARMPAITFVVNPGHAAYCGRLHDKAMVERLATGRGILGSAADYLRSTVAQLDAEGIHDRRLRTILHRVEAWPDQTPNESGRVPKR